MPRERITKTFTITTSADVMKRLERFFAMLHFNSNWGHSSFFGLFVDGDGADKITVDPKPTNHEEVDLLGGVGFDVEIAQDNSYTGRFFAKERTAYWVKDKKLYRQKYSPTEKQFEPELIKDRSES